jgi:SPP1 gp7 family putative phage head morphogenesis protein
VAEADVVTDVYEAIRDAIDNGTTFEQFKAEVGGELLASWLNEGQVPEPLNRLEVIFRANLQTAYAAGRLQAQTNPDVLQVRPFWMYDALIDSRTSGICRNLNGTIRPADDSWWGQRYPPNHFNCRSSVRSLTRAEAERRGGVTASPTLQEADSGWRSMPAFEPPELKDYPAEIATELARKLEGGA